MRLRVGAECRPDAYSTQGHCQWHRHGDWHASARASGRRSGPLVPQCVRRGPCTRSQPLTSDQAGRGRLRWHLQAPVWQPEPGLRRRPRSHWHERHPGAVPIQMANGACQCQQPEAAGCLTRMARSQEHQPTTPTTPTTPSEETPSTVNLTPSHRCCVRGGVTVPVGERERALRGYQRKSSASCH